MTQMWSIIGSNRNLTFNIVLFSTRRPRSQGCGHLLSQPADVFEVGVRGRGGRGTQVGVDVGQRVRQQRGHVGVDCREPRVGRGAVFAPQHHGVLAVRGVKLQQPAGGDRSGREKC